MTVDLSEYVVTLDGDDPVLVHRPNGKHGPECFVAFTTPTDTLESLATRASEHQCSSAPTDVIDTAVHVLMRTPGTSRESVDPIYDHEAREFARALDAAGLLRTEVIT